MAKKVATKFTFFSLLSFIPLKQIKGQLHEKGVMRFHCFFLCSLICIAKKFSRMSSSYMHHFFFFVKMFVYRMIFFSCIILIGLRVHCILPCMAVTFFFYRNIVVIYVNLFIFPSSPKWPDALMLNNLYRNIFPK